MSTGWKLLPTAVSVSLLIAACSSEEASPAPTGPVETLPPVATEGPAPTTTAAATTTSEPPAATTTSEPPATSAPTTAAPPSGTPIDATIPLFVGGVESADAGWLSLGAWAATAWQPAFADDGTPNVPTIAAGSTLAIAGLQAGATEGVTGPVVAACFDDRVGPSIDPAVGAAEPPGFGYSAVALPANWPLHPRPVVVVDAAVPAYQAAGEAVFASDPVDPSLAAVEQIVLADLDGDGDEEALVTFEHVALDGATGAEGDLAAVLLIDTATGASSTVVSSFVGPVEEGSFAVTEQFRVLDLVDLNGDGRMEVVIRSWYYEGAAALVFEYDGASLNEVLSAGCGA